MKLVMLIVCHLKNLINLIFIYFLLEIEDVFELGLGNRSTTILIEIIESPIHFLLVDENILIDSCHTEL